MESQTISTPLLQAVPIVNNFIYPPLRPLALDSGVNLVDYIALHEPVDSPFTIFVSIPFCEVRCHSCHMFKGFLPPKRERDSVFEDYLDSLFRQIDAYAATPRFSSAKCGAIYLGGGTASVLSPDQVKRLLKKLTESFKPDQAMEITFEGNPNDFSLDYLLRIKELGITRLSIGYQSAIDATLKALNSPHGSDQSIAAVKSALTAGFHTVNVDLLFNVPGQTEQQWQQDLAMLIDLGPQGLSPGDYIVFEGTVAESLISSGRLGQQQNADMADCWYQYSYELLERHGYHELVRNIFARTGHPYKYVDLSCRENREILGLGAGAYSFIDRHQFQTAVDAHAFSSAIKSGGVFHAVALSARASEKNLMERFVIHNFFAAVLNRKHFTARFGTDPLAVFPQEIQDLELKGLVTIDEDEIRLTDLGRKWRRNVYYAFRSPEFKSPADKVVCITRTRSLSKN